MSDPTESTRRAQVEEINSNAGEREELEKRYGKVWDTKELQEEFTVHGFLAPYITVTHVAMVQKSVSTRG